MAIGFFIALASLWLIRQEFIRASRDHKRSFSHLSDENADQVMAYLKKLELQMDEVNASFYEIVSDLEGKYSVHEKEIELLQEKFERLGQRTYDTAHRLHAHNARQAGQQWAENDPDPQVKIIQRAVELKRDGLSLGMIAKELDMGVGELQLLLKTKR